MQFRTSVISRGSTVIFLSSFFDQDGNPVNPQGAIVNIVAFGADPVTVNMVPPGTPGGDPLKWSAQWDSRGATPGTVFYSVHTTGPTPVTVSDGQFQLAANAANLLTF